MRARLDFWKDAYSHDHGTITVSDVDNVSDLQRQLHFDAAGSFPTTDDVEVYADLPNTYTIITTTVDRYGARVVITKAVYW